MTTSTDIPISDLPPMRRARALTVLATLEHHGGTLTPYERLEGWLVRRGQDGTFRWSRAELDQALNDAAAAGLLAVEPGRLCGTIDIFHFPGGTA